MRQNFYFVEETASNLVRFQYQEGGGVFEDRSSGKGDEQDGGQAGSEATTGTKVGACDQPGRISGDSGRDPVVNRSA